MNDTHSEEKVRLMITFVWAHIFMNHGIHEGQSKSRSSLLDYVVQQVNCPLLQIHVIRELRIDHGHISQGHRRLWQSKLQLPGQGSDLDVYIWTSGNGNKMSPWQMTIQLFAIGYE